MACLAHTPNRTSTVGGGAGGGAGGAAAGCQSFESWGFTDRVSWLNGDRCTPTQGPCHALPFDTQYRPKPAVAAMLQVLQN